MILYVYSLLNQVFIIILDEICQQLSFTVFSSDSGFMDLFACLASFVSRALHSFLSFMKRVKKCSYETSVHFLFRFFTQFILSFPEKSHCCKDSICSFNISDTVFSGYLLLSFLLLSLEVSFLSLFLPVIILMFSYSTVR